MSVVTERVATGVEVNPTEMVHLAYDETPTVAICGARIQGRDAEGQLLDCHVCAEIEANDRRLEWGE